MASSGNLSRRRRILSLGEEDGDANFPNDQTEGEEEIESDKEENSQIGDCVSENILIQKSHTIQRKRPFKTEDDEIPLPDPFPIPKNYRIDVETSLKSGKMNRQTKSAFFSSIASAVLQYKKYPTKEDYISVARAITVKYPFLKDHPM